MEFKISELMSLIDDDSVMLEECNVASADTIKEVVMHKIHREETGTRPARRWGRTLLIAAVVACLMLALGATAYAVGLSIHRQRQDELRRQLGINENAVSDYYEQSVPADETEVREGVTLLSTINDGQFQHVYVNVCPVEPEAVNTFGSLIDNEDGTHSFYEFSFTNDGENFGMALPFVSNISDGSTIQELVASAYDEASKTLTLECACWKSQFPFDKPFDLTLQLRYLTDKPNDHTYDTELIRTFGTVTVDPTGRSVREIRFDEPVPFVNETTGGAGKVIGLDLSSMNVELILEHENMETMYISGDLEGSEKEDYFNEQVGWIKAADKLAWSLTLTYSDGSTRSNFGVMTTSYEDGHVVSHCGLGSTTININDVVSISIGDVTFDLDSMS